MVKSYMEKVEVEEKTIPVVKDFMIDQPVTIPLGEDIYKVMRTLLQYKTTGAPVLDEAGNLAGFISEKDCLRLVALNAYHGSRRTGKVEEYMTCKDALTTVTPETGLYKVAQLFIQLPYKKLIVTSDDRLIGLVRRDDVLKAVID